MKLQLKITTILIFAVVFAISSCDFNNETDESSSKNKTVNVSGITLNKTTADIRINTTEQLTATIDPAGAANQEVRWISSDESIATVSEDGLVTMRGHGSAVILAVTKDGGFIDKCTVNVSYILRDRGPAGGIIFYINSNGATDGWTYLEASPYGFPAPWSDNSSTPIPGADGIAIGTGRQNTIDILNSNPCPNSAADVCRNYEINGYYDWFLPSKDELNKMFVNLVSGTDENGHTFTSVYGYYGNSHWSSSEYSDSKVWTQFFGIYKNFLPGMQLCFDKGGNFRAVRPVRAF